MGPTKSWDDMIQFRSEHVNLLIDFFSMKGDRGSAQVPEGGDQFVAASAVPDEKVRRYSADLRLQVGGAALWLPESDGGADLLVNGTEGV